MRSHLVQAFLAAGSSSACFHCSQQSHSYLYTLPFLASSPPPVVPFFTVNWPAYGCSPSEAAEAVADEYSSLVSSSAPLVLFPLSVSVTIPLGPLSFPLFSLFLDGGRRLHEIVREPSRQHHGGAATAYGGESGGEKTNRCQENHKAHTTAIPRQVPKPTETK